MQVMKPSKKSYIYLASKLIKKKKIIRLNRQSAKNIAGIITFVYKSELLLPSQKLFPNCLKARKCQISAYK